MEYDVVIIGAGPAGCAAAIHCCAQGLKTLIISSKKISVEKEEIVPSESIHPGVASLLQQLDAAHCIDTASRGTYQGIEADGRRNAFGEDENGPWEGHHINRAMFDAGLLEIAVKKGAVLAEGTVADIIINTAQRATGITKQGQNFSCKYIIDAGGMQSIAAKKAGFKKVFYSPPLFTWTGVAIGDLDRRSAGNFTQFIPHKNGWTWLAPEPGGRYTWTRLETKGDALFTPPETLKNHEQIGNIKKTNRRWQVCRPVCTEQLILCGDAAGVIDPAAGQGILNALLSGIMAATAAYSCISKPDFEAFYLAKYDDWFFTRYVENVEKLKSFYELHSINIFDKK
jgi:flavin-dependent dehydrogenase